MPYKHGVTGSSPVVPTTQFGAVVQLVRTPACHAGGRGFKSLPRRHFFDLPHGRSPAGGASFSASPIPFAAVAQSVERILGKDEVGGSNPPSSSTKSLEPQRVQGFLCFDRNFCSFVFQHFSNIEKRKRLISRGML